MSFILLGILNSQAAAGGAGAYDLLETTVLTSAAASVSFTGLDAYTDYKHLQIRAVSKNNGTFTGGLVRITFNSDTGSNYAIHNLRGDGSSVLASGLTDRSFIGIGNSSGGDNPTNEFASLVTDILDFSSSSKNTTVRSLNGVSASLRTIVSLDSGFYNNTSPVTQIDITDSANFVTGSRFSLYGVK